VAQAFQPLLAQAKACGYQKLPYDCDFHTETSGCRAAKYLSDFFLYLYEDS
jgi:hypothetical protein